MRRNHAILLCAFALLIVLLHLACREVGYRPAVTALRVGMVDLQEPVKWELLAQMETLSEPGVRRALSAINGGSTDAAVTLRPRDVFVAYGGVVCLVFEGFPDALLHLKRAVDVEGRKTMPEAWPAENMGSKWAKVTLAALDASAAAQSLDVSVLGPQLRQLCLDFRPKLAAIQLHATALKLVRFATRDLARRKDVRRIALPSAVAGGDHVSVETEAFTSDVVNEFFDPRNTVHYCETHMNKKCSNSDRYLEVLADPMHTLIVDLHDSDGSGLAELLVVLREFRRAVDSLLGQGTYHWFAEDSLHCTVRGL
jgi:hypothetical protein